MIGENYNNIQLNDKQEEFLLAGLSRINLLEGSVRSGKTWISLVAWAFFVADSPRNAEFLMVGKTMTTLKRNCLTLLQDLEPTFRFNTGSKEAVLYGRRIWLEGADNERAENKIRGMTLSGAYVDELTMIPEGFYYMLLSRLSMPGAKLIATTNPDSPMHYVYKDIICNDKIHKRVTKFLIQDNVKFLGQQYIDDLSAEYKGVFYRRFLLGEWVVAEGLVYPSYDNTVKTEDRSYTDYVISMDYGILNPTAMLLFGKTNDGVWYLVNEYYHSGRDTNEQKTDEQYYAELEKLAGDKKVSELIIDPSAASFIALCRQRGRFRTRKADNSVLDGIQNTSLCLARRSVLVNDCCKNTIREFGLYSWNSDRMDKDAVIKENDHAMDALRYFVQTKRIYVKVEPYHSIFG